MNILASPRAVDELKKAAEARRQQAGTDTIRVMVRSRCGCGAAHFAMGFDEPVEGDNRIDVGGVTLLVDPSSAPLLDNAQVDYSDDLMGKGFRISSPAAGGGCGCGGHGHRH
jgi:iron-sulfur cluster assembly accessory protein